MLRKNLDYLATLFFEAGITHWAVSPGSRNAPIVAGFLRHGGFYLHSFPDERCAAFAAMGMSQAKSYPCGVICTSGTAVLNLYPAICEAFYQRIPLMVITADRPEELIDQWDGQTIHQKDIFEKHVLESFETPQDLDIKDKSDEIEKIVYKAVNMTVSPTFGPVHINIPLRDPIYNGMNEEFYNHKPHNAFELYQIPAQKIDRNYLHVELAKYKRIILVAGQMQPNEMIQTAMKTVSLQLPVLGDINANVFGGSFMGWDAALLNANIPNELQPDLLITIGLSIVSKSLKLFLRTNKPLAHWHISISGFTGDPFQTQPQTKEIDILEFLEAISDIQGIENSEYYELWQSHINTNQNNDYLNSQPLVKAEYEMVQLIMKHATVNTCLHFGNSMSVRYGSWVGVTNAQVYTNRGTSGIDGTLSTAVGYALANPIKKVLCILGDISFFYDSNALWTNELPNNLGIIILNNKGGAIFDFIQGPKTENKLHPFVVTPHNRTASKIAADYGINYYTNKFSNHQLIIELLNTKTPFIIELTHE